MPNTELMPLQRADIGILRGGPRPHRALAQIDDLEGGFGRLGVVFEQRTLGDHGANRAFDVALRQIVPLGGLRIERFEHLPRGVAGVARTRDRDVVAARINDDSEPSFDQRQVLAIRSDQRRGRAIVVEIDHDLRLGRDCMLRSNLRPAFAFRSSGSIQYPFFTNFETRGNDRTLPVSDRLAIRRGIESPCAMQELGRGRARESMRF